MDPTGLISTAMNLIGTQLISNLESPRINFKAFCNEEKLKLVFTRCHIRYRILEVKINRDVQVLNPLQVEATPDSSHELEFDETYKHALVGAPKKNRIDVEIELLPPENKAFKDLKNKIKLSLKELFDPRTRPSNTAYREYGLSANVLDELLGRFHKWEDDSEHAIIAFAGGCVPAEKVFPKVILISAEPGLGKTLLALEIFSNVQILNSPHRSRCLFLSSDQNKHELESYCKTFNIKFYQNEEIKLVPGENFNNFSQTDLFTLEDWFALEELGYWGSSDEQFPNEILDQIRQNDIIIIDSLNVTKLESWRRESLERLITNFRRSGKIVIFLLEDYSKISSEEIKKLQMDCEFLSDIVIEMKEELTENYVNKYIRVKKRRYGNHAIGRHLYKILKSSNAMKNIVGPNAGIVVFPSIHKYLSNSRDDTYSNDPHQYTSTGIEELNTFLLEGKQGCNAIPQNSSIALQGEKGGYKIPIALTILTGDWFVNHTSFPRTDGYQALLISLDEEFNLKLDGFPHPQGLEFISHQSEYSNEEFKSDFLDSLSSLSEDNYEIISDKNKLKSMFIESGILKENGSRIEINSTKISSEQWTKFANNYCAGALGTTDSDKHNKFISDSINLLKQKYYPCNCNPTCETKLKDADQREIIFPGNNENQKIVFNQWCLKSGVSGKCAEKRIIVANFRPGCITPEEFIKSIEVLLEKCQFKRVMFNSTALIPKRFPLLEQEPLFIPALVDLFKAKNVVSIFIDPQEDNALNSEISYTLTQVADYQVSLEEVRGRYGYVDELVHGKPKIAHMILKNVRGKMFTDNAFEVSTENNNLLSIKAIEENPLKNVLKDVDRFLVGSAYHLRQIQKKLRRS